MEGPDTAVMGKRARRKGNASSKGSNRREEGLSEDMYDEVDSFHRQQEQIKLAATSEDGRFGRNSDDEDMADDDGVEDVLSWRS